jgi:membrane protease subunit HflC
MNRTALTTGLIILGIAAVVAYLTLFTVSQTQQAIVLEFGKPKREIKDPGLHYKVPFIQNVEYFDKRILDIDTARKRSLPPIRSGSSWMPLRATGSPTR